MIVAERKHIQDIKNFIEKYDRVMVLGCGTCTKVCQAGGESQANVVASALRISFLKDGKEKEIIEDCITRQCEPEFADEVKNKVAEKNVQAIVSLSVSFLRVAGSLGDQAADVVDTGAEHQPIGDHKRCQ